MKWNDKRTSIKKKYYLSLYCNYCLVYKNQNTFTINDVQLILFDFFNINYSRYFS